jgi:hypothetical protein
MASQGTAGGILPIVIGIDRGEPRLFGRRRRQSHRPRNIQQQIKIEIWRARYGGSEPADCDEPVSVIVGRPIRFTNVVGILALKVTWETIFVLVLVTVGVT